MLACKHESYQRETSPPETVLASFVLLLTRAAPLKEVNFILISNCHYGFCYLSTYKAKNPFQLTWKRELLE